MTGLPKLIGRTCPKCGPTYELPWLITDSGNIEAKQLAADDEVHDCSDRIISLKVVR